jgi:hypothetical protein
MQRLAPVVAAIAVVALFAALLSNAAPLRSSAPDPAVRARLTEEMERQRDALSRLASLLPKSINHHPRETPALQERVARLGAQRIPDHADPALNALAREITELQGRVALLMESVRRWDDRALVGWLQTSRERGDTPQEVVDEIFRAPTLSTLEPGHRQLLLAADLQPVPGLQRGVPDFRRCRTVMYWVRYDRDADSGNPRVVGLAWDEDGTSRMFHALVPPP